MLDLINNLHNPNCKHKGQQKEWPSMPSMSDDPVFAHCAHAEAKVPLHHFYRNHYAALVA